MNILYEKMLMQKESIEKRIQDVRNRLKNLPPGKLICAKNGKYYKWYVSDGKTKKYLPKEKRHLASKLAEKKYYKQVLEDLQQESRAINFYLRHSNPNGGKAEQMLLDNPEYQQLFISNFKPLSQELREWAESPYEKNPNYQEQLIFKTSFGSAVRSKSEVLIDLYLRAHKIPFRYEEKLRIGDVTLYPDFTIRHPETGQLYYWEHFGLADDLSYVQNMLSKLKLYISDGIIPNIQLITTYETGEHPLNGDMVEKTIQHYLL